MGSIQIVNAVRGNFGLLIRQICLWVKFNGAFHFLHLSARIARLLCPLRGRDLQAFLMPTRIR